MNFAKTCSSASASSRSTFRRLRDRREDIPALAEHFLRQAAWRTSAEAALAGDVFNELRTRAWTGNVRELRNAIEHAAIVARGQPIRPEHLPAAAAKPDVATPSQALEIQGLLAAWAERTFRDQAESADTTLYEQFLQLAEPPILRAILEKCGGNRAAAAQNHGDPSRNLASETAEVWDRLRSGISFVKPSTPMTRRCCQFWVLRHLNTT